MIFYISFHKDIPHQQPVMCDCHGCVNFHWPWELLTTHLQPLGITGILILIQRGFHGISASVRGRDTDRPSERLLSPSYVLWVAGSAIAPAERAQTELTMRTTLHLHKYRGSNEIQF